MISSTRVKLDTCHLYSWKSSEIVKQDHFFVLICVAAVAKSTVMYHVHCTLYNCTSALPPPPTPFRKKKECWRCENRERTLETPTHGKNVSQECKAFLLSYEFRSPPPLPTSKGEYEPATMRTASTQDCEGRKGRAIVAVSADGKGPEKTTAKNLGLFPLRCNWTKMVFTSAPMHW